MRQADDAVAVEEPLELRCFTAGSDEPRPLNVTMRTPGDDLDWAYGFLFTEGLIASAHDVVDAPAFLAAHQSELEVASERYPQVKFHALREHAGQHFAEAM